MFVSLVLSFLIAHPVDSGFASTQDPSDRWKTIHTENFQIHFVEAHTPIAQRLSQIAEIVHRELTEEMRWKARRKTHVVIDPRVQSAGGFATPIPYNLIYLNPYFPLAGSSIDSYDDWLSLLFTHEYTHTLHVDMVGGINRIFRALMGRAWVPNAVQPQWLLEGLAMKHETDFTTSGRGRSSFVEMHLRVASLSDSFAPIHRATYWNDQYPFGNVAYWYGVGFHQFLADRFGDGVWIDFAHKNARWPIFGFFNFKTQDLLGHSFYDLWKEWEIEQGVYWKSLVKERPSQHEALWSLDGFRLLQRPAVWTQEDGKKKLILHLSKNDRPGLYSLDLSEEDPRPQLLSRHFRGRSLQVQQNRLFYTQLGAAGRYRSVWDIHSLDLETQKTTRITSGAGIAEISLNESSLVGVREQGFRSSLLRIERPSEESLKQNFESLKLDAFEVLFESGDFTQIGMPALSPLNEDLVFSMQPQSRCRNLYLLSGSATEPVALTQDCQLQYDPVWSEDGRSIWFGSDQKFEDSPHAVFNLFELQLANRRLRQKSHSWHGVFWPVLDGEKIWVGHYENRGFQLQSIQRDSISKPTRFEQSHADRYPPILGELKDSTEEVKETEIRDYRLGAEILPGYLLPIWLFSESTSLVGGMIGSQDPIGRHQWNGLAYFHWQARSPGGSFQYRYRGFGSSDLILRAGAGISEIGRIFIRKDRQPNESVFLSDIYYERNWNSSLALQHRLQKWPVGISAGVFFEDRRSLKKIPEAAIQTEAELQEDYPEASGRPLPEEGKQAGVFSSISWSTGAESHPRGVSPLFGHEGRLSLRYAPKALGSDFKSLVTSLNSRLYYGSKTQGIAWQAQLALQWLDALYQSSFRLGGSSGEFDLPSLRIRSFSLRGLPIGRFRGEGVVASSLEYRFRLSSAVPGWGTAPFWFKNIQAALFGDLGQVFQFQEEGSVLAGPSRNFSFNRMTVSSGAELRSSISVYYAPPIVFRLGYARVLLLEGSSAWPQNISEIYFQVGQSF